MQSQHSSGRVHAQTSVHPGSTAVMKGVDFQLAVNCVIGIPTSLCCTKEIPCCQAEPLAPMVMGMTAGAMSASLNHTTQCKYQTVPQRCRQGPTLPVQHEGCGHPPCHLSIYGRVWGAHPPTSWSLTQTAQSTRHCALQTAASQAPTIFKTPKEYYTNPLPAHHGHSRLPWPSSSHHLIRCTAE